MLRLISRMSNTVMKVFMDLNCHQFCESSVAYLVIYNFLKFNTFLFTQLIVQAVSPKKKKKLLPKLASTFLNSGTWSLEKKSYCLSKISFYFILFYLKKILNPYNTPGQFFNIQRHTCIEPSYRMLRNNFSCKRLNQN